MASDREAHLDLSVLNNDSITLYNRLLNGEITENDLPPSRVSTDVIRLVRCLNYGNFEYSASIRSDVNRSRLDATNKDEVHFLRISLTNISKTTDVTFEVLTGGPYSGNYYVGYVLMDDTCVQTLPNLRDNGNFRQSSLDIRIQRSGATIFVSQSGNRIMSLRAPSLYSTKILHVVTGIRRTVPYVNDNYKRIINENRELAFTSFVTVDDNVVHGNVVLVGPTKENLMLRQSDLNTLSSEFKTDLIEERQEPALATTADDSKGGGSDLENLESSVKTKETPAPRESKSPTKDSERVIHRGDFKMEGAIKEGYADEGKPATSKDKPLLEFLEDFEETRSVDDLITGGEIVTVLSSKPPLNVSIVKPGLPQLMDKDDALKVNILIRKYIVDQGEPLTQETLNCYLIALIQCALIYSTVWGMKTQRKMSVLFSIGSNGRLKELDYLDIISYCFKPFEIPYLNPLRKYLRYYSTTAINLIRNGVCTVNNALAARHGTPSKYSYLSFDFLILDNRFTSPTERVVHTKTRRFAIENVTRDTSDRNLHNTDELLWR
ncbi:minor coat protein [Pistachio ampelovirus A]|uniref:Minor coat protein n=1 Tax=Pistachio ampelovirus A TaxID=2093224 RepID=A0A499PV91_9CLOS|nr:minor coat protein [Pistachio ampelovirus A]AVN99312.1 minor coat protein [Pistachio ampelovirus A]